MKSTKRIRVQNPTKPNYRRLVVKLRFTTRPSNLGEFCMNPDSKKYIFNLETTKIELHFEKADYTALSEKQKQEIKSAFLWSNKGKSWVSRAKEPNLYRAKQVAEKLGFTAEQREGERLSYGEQLERQAERAEARADRYEGYAVYQ